MAHRYSLLVGGGGAGGVQGPPHHNHTHTQTPVGQSWVGLAVRRGLGPGLGVLVPSAIVAAINCKDFSAILVQKLGLGTKI